MKFKVKNESKWDTVDVADSALNLLILATGALFLLYGIVEGSRALWPMVA